MVNWPSPRRVLSSVALAIASLALAGPAAATDTLVALTTSNELRTFDSSTPGDLSDPILVTGLQGSDLLMAIDKRPATGGLYALGVSPPGNLLRLYSVNPATGAGTPLSPGQIALSGPDQRGFSIDFDPVADVLRVVVEREAPGDGEGRDLLLTLNPTTGNQVGNLVDLAYTGGDASIRPVIGGIAYTNSFAVAAATTLYGLDVNDDILSTIAPSGELTIVGENLFPAQVDDIDKAGFDITPGGKAYVSVIPDGHPTGLYRLNPSTGASTDVGSIGNGSETIRDIAVLAADDEPGPGPGPDPVDPSPNVAPVLTAASLTNKRFAVGKAPTPLTAARRKVKLGTTFRFGLSERATVTIAIQRARPGRRVAGRCRKPARRLRKRKRCTRFKGVGKLTRSGVQGANSVPFSGRIGRRALKPGRYRARLQAVDSSGAPSEARLLRFRIVRR